MTPKTAVHDDKSRCFGDRQTELYSVPSLAMSQLCDLRQALVVFLHLQNGENQNTDVLEGFCALNGITDLRYIGVYQAQGQSSIPTIAVIRL